MISASDIHSAEWHRDRTGRSWPAIADKLNTDIYRLRDALRRQQGRQIADDELTFLGGKQAWLISQALQLIGKEAAGHIRRCVEQILRDVPPWPRELTEAELAKIFDRIDGTAADAKLDAYAVPVPPALGNREATPAEIEAADKAVREANRKHVAAAKPNGEPPVKVEAAFDPLVVGVDGVPKCPAGMQLCDEAEPPPPDEPSVMEFARTLRAKDVVQCETAKKARLLGAMLSRLGKGYRSVRRCQGGKDVWFVYVFAKPTFRQVAAEGAAKKAWETMRKRRAAK